MKYVLVLILYIFNLYAYPQEERVPGGIIKLYFDERPEIFYDNKKQKAFIQKDEGRWIVLLPIPIHEKSKTLKLTSKTASKTQDHNISIQAKRYKEQHIKIANSEYVKPSSKETHKRIINDLEIKRKNYARHTPLQVKNLKMIKPLESNLRHDFGRRRFFNGVAKNPHLGIDLSGRCGDKIKAPLDGLVIILGDLFYNGKMMLIDHGQGLITAYSHMSKIYKPSGTRIKQGEFIGEVGKSGRVSGPHLHWSVYLNGIAVNPDLFLEDASL